MVFTAPSISGPWTRQASPQADVNCRNTTVSICPGTAYAPEPSPANNPTIPAQGYSVNAIPTADGDTARLH